jgi:hypothetical protein
LVLGFAAEVAEGVEGVADAGGGGEFAGWLGVGFK